MLKEFANSRYRFNIGPDHLPNENPNYSLSPAARHAMKDGSLEPLFRSTFSNTYNRKLKMRDTFTKIFPSYIHAEPTVSYTNKPVTHIVH